MSHLFGGVIASAALVLGTPASTTTAAQRPSAPKAEAAQRLSAASKAYLHRVRSSGAEILEEGAIYGSLSGKVKARFNVGATVTGAFTVYLSHGGTINGRGSGTLRNAGLYQAFNGSLSITGGSGRYTHAHGRGGFSGTINRHTYAINIETTGTLYY